MMEPGNPFTHGGSMTRLPIFVALVAFAGLAGCASSKGVDDQKPASGSDSAPSVNAEAKRAEVAEPSAAEAPRAPLEVAARCEAACKRNGEGCDVLDVPGCATRCAASFEGAGACEGLVSDFFACVDKSALACEEGDKLRPEGCRKEVTLAAGCIYKQKQLAAEDSADCAELCKTEGRCKLEGKMCVATSQEDCASSSFCKEAGWCTFVVNYCTNVVE